MYYIREHRKRRQPIPERLYLQPYPNVKWLARELHVTLLRRYRSFERLYWRTYLDVSRAKQGNVVKLLVQ